MIKSYRFAIILLGALSIGAACGLYFGESASAVKPLGDLFLNLLFTVAVPLVFFSVSSAFSGTSNLKQLGKVLGLMIVVFIGTGLAASLLMISSVLLFPIELASTISLEPAVAPGNTSLLEGIVQSLTVSNFTDLFSRRHMLALIVFSALFGLATSLAGEKAKAVKGFLFSGAHIMMGLIKLVMLYAPIGLACYFAHIVGSLGSDLLNAYAQVIAIYYPVAFIYFLGAFTIYVYWARGKEGVQKFWPAVLTPALTAFGTGSSVAAIPANLEAADKIGTPREISELVRMVLSKITFEV